jgi:hypothetical protein
MVAPLRGIPCLCSSDAAPFPFLCPPDESAGYRQNLRGWRFCPPFGGQSLPNRLSKSGRNAAMKIDLALAEIERCRESQFDPLVVEAFLSLQDIRPAA